MVIVPENVVTDSCNNTNIENKIGRAYDNAGPEFKIKVEPVYECE
jgi:hypothetical protein